MEPITAEERRLLVATTAPLAIGLAAFAMDAVTAPFAGQRVAGGVLCITVILVAVAGITGERSGAVMCAVVSGLAFDFFHVAPVRVLHAHTCVEVVAGLVLVALLTTPRQRQWVDASSV